MKLKCDGKEFIMAAADSGVDLSTENVLWAIGAAGQLAHKWRSLSQAFTVASVAILVFGLGVTKAAQPVDLLHMIEDSVGLFICIGVMILFDRKLHTMMDKVYKWEASAFGRA